MDLDEEGGLEGHGQHPLLHHRALNVVVLDDDDDEEEEEGLDDDDEEEEDLDDDVLLEDLDGVELVGALPFGQHHLPEGAFSQNH